MRYEIRTSFSLLFSLLLIVAGMVCSKGKNDGNDERMIGGDSIPSAITKGLVDVRMIGGDSISSAITTELVDKNLLSEQEDIVYYIKVGTGKKKGTVISGKRVVSYDSTDTQSVSFADVYDLGKSTVPDDSTVMEIAVYRRDDTEFSFLIPRGEGREVIFFETLKKLWRDSQDSGGDDDAAEDTSEGVVFGVQEIDSTPSMFKSLKK
jgi:hypothetical protein